jgi:hypothetical protein
MLGVALQAEHADPARVAAAPVLAVFDGQALRTCEAPTVLAGYGGDIAATAEGFAVSCPRAGVVARWHADGRWGGQHPQAHVCALSSGTDAAPGPVWAGGESAVAWGGPNAEGRVLALPGLPPLRLDNHWALLQARGGDIDHVDHTERREAP